ncbi:MAG: Asp-tRNA(Asn)/Glu-tRNA(Gln) amidotransferase subunit GatC [Bacteroidia bacterium]|jgi:aspartyl-tRNA(Asn)/glutamyl-tRNA(Gln) amidotransferase subunit C|tara:strand:+ start:21690 stop:21980 length:291 start_codon:yes stop_codon:yes gene_type:complete
MSISDKKIDELAHLARLEFSATEKEAIKGDLDRIIDFCDKLKEVDTSSVEPLIYLSQEQTVLREDAVKQLLTKQEALKNAPSADSDYFKVPKVITK